MKNIYLLKYTDVNLFDDPFITALQPDDQVSQIRMGIAMDQKTALQRHLDHAELYRLGTYDQEKGLITIFPEKEWLDDLGKYVAKEG